MIARRATETQRAFVERALRTEGRVATYDVLYQAQFEDGRRTSLTRLAAIIHTLRDEGWQIETLDSGGVATYVLTTVRRQEAAPTWSCAFCGGQPNGRLESALNGHAFGRCANCKVRRLFRPLVAA